MQAQGRSSKRTATRWLGMDGSKLHYGSVHPSRDWWDPEGRALCLNSPKRQAAQHLGSSKWQSSLHGY